MANSRWTREVVAVEHELTALESAKLDMERAICYPDATQEDALLAVFTRVEEAADRLAQAAFDAQAEILRVRLLRQHRAARRPAEEDARMNGR